MPTAIESAASIGDKDNDDDVSDDGDDKDQGATKKRKVLDVLEVDMFPPDDILLMDGGGGMEFLSQVSGMTSSPARMGDNTSAGARAGAVLLLKILLL